ncbi:MAG: 50S ribosomal protein L11 methyltransferase [Candidatus Omnitrophica bacterium]|nr:50S ribosomal protein L11 methyltransferase [Candidatus Omnitrophota bacterium]
MVLNRKLIECNLVVFSSKPQLVEAIKAVLLALGVSQEDLVEENKKDKVFLKWYVTSPRQARLFTENLKKQSFSHLRFYLRKLKDADWKTRWKSFFRPFNITAQIRLIPLFYKGIDNQNKPFKIYLDTTFAFGTGQHPTTRLMADLISLRKGKIKKFLDVGTGSGILAIVANCYQAEKIWAIDCAPEAIKTASNNFKRNKLKNYYLKCIDFKDFSCKEKFDFVCANLITENLLQFKNRLINLVEANGYLAVSGIFQDNYLHFRRKFKDKQLRCIRVRKKKKWYALLFKKLVSKS